jgi:hypothetical protein
MGKIYSKNLTHQSSSQFVIKLDVYKRRNHLTNRIVDNLNDTSQRNLQNVEIKKNDFIDLLLDVYKCPTSYILHSLGVQESLILNYSKL